MWISVKTMMELLERIIKAENTAAELEKRVALLEKRPIVSGDVGKSKDDEDVNASRVVQELLHGVIDDKTGRVMYTDGR